MRNIILLFSLFYHCIEPINQILFVPSNDKNDIEKGWNRNETQEAEVGFSLQANAELTLPIKAYLQGAMLKIPNKIGYGTLMRDDLRANNLIPKRDPYLSRPEFTHVNNPSQDAILDNEVLKTTGNNAIVDWVFVELRDKTDISRIIATKSGLIQRDGNVVAIDGFSSLTFDLPTDYYYITLRHRNHLRVTTQGAVLLNQTTKEVDFTKTNTLIYGTKPLVNIYSSSNALWAGDANSDEKIISTGKDTDVNTVSQQILKATRNTNFSTSYLLKAYNDSDIDMNGTVAASGSQTDIFLMSLNVLRHSSNNSFSGSYVIQNPVQRTVTNDVVAERILLYQRNNWGWRNGRGMSVYTQTLTDSMAKVVRAQKAKLDAYMDNGSSTDEIGYLIKIFKQTNNKKYLEAAQNGIKYLLAAQYNTSGGWPQSYPDSSSYHKHITYNDGTMTRVLTVMKSIAEGTNGYEVVDRTIMENAKIAFQKGVKCILNTQYRQNGKLTVWCGQHDKKTLLPAKARAYELPSLSGAESVEVVKFLMSINNPDASVKNAIKAAVAWLDSNKIVGINLKLITDTSQPSGKDLIVVKDPNSTLWARFYDLKTNKPFFTGRDSVPKATLAEIPNERRLGYDYYGRWPQNLINKQYPAWLKKWD